MKYRFMTLVLLIGIMTVASQAYAGTKDFLITLRVTSIYPPNLPPVVGPGCPGGVIPGTFGCHNGVGDIHVGRFSVDDSLLQQEEDNLPGTISNFFLEISPITWNQNYPFFFGPYPPYPISFFSGFVRPDPNNPCCVIRPSPSPGFDVHNGTITGVKGTIVGLQGGVFGPADVPFVDFHGRYFGASDGLYGLTGTLLVTPAPTPATYLVCALFDQTKAVNSGATIPIKLQLCDANGANLSSPSIPVIATSLTQVSTVASGAIEAASNSNPDNNFRFDPTIGETGGYIFNLKTTGLASGT
jgi:hypothetical protein